jgi:hypothetical protein
VRRAALLALALALAGCQVNVSDNVVTFKVNRAPGKAKPPISEILRERHALREQHPSHERQHQAP